MLRRVHVWLGWLFALACALLVVSNVRLAVRNQTVLGDEDTPRPRSSNIATVASLNSMNVVRYTFATFYRLRVLADHALLVPGRLASLHFLLERVSRLHTQIVPMLEPLPAAAIERLDAQVKYWWAFDAESPLGVIVGGPDDGYVLAERADHQLYLILPESLYRQALGR